MKGKINTKEELDILLEYCKSIPYSSIKDGGSFYKIKSQSFIYPNGKVENREYIDKRKASVVIPITEDGNIIFVVQPVALSEWCTSRKKRIIRRNRLCSKRNNIS